MNIKRGLKKFLIGDRPKLIMPIAKNEKNRVSSRPFSFIGKYIVIFFGSVNSFMKRFNFSSKPSTLKNKEEDEVWKRINREQREDNIRAWKKIGSSNYYESLEETRKSSKTGDMKYH